MSVMANPAGARHMSYAEYNALSDGAKTILISKAGIVIASTAGFHGVPPFVQYEFMLRSEWEKLSPTDQKTMMDLGDIVMITAN